jgi:hypothetical protein
MNETTKPTGNKAKPRYATLRSRFAAEAQLQADTILANLIPEGALRPDQLKRLQLAVWRTAQSILRPINDCGGEIDRELTAAEWRDLLSHTTNDLIAKAHQVEKAIAAEYSGGDVCRTCLRGNVGLFPMEDGLPICVECGGCNDEEDEEPQ